MIVHRRILLTHQRRRSRPCQRSRLRLLRIRLSTTLNAPPLQNQPQLPHSGPSHHPLCPFSFHSPLHQTQHRRRHLPSNHFSTSTTASPTTSPIHSSPPRSLLIRITPPSRIERTVLRRCVRIETEQGNNVETDEICRRSRRIAIYGL